MTSIQIHSLTGIARAVVVAIALVVLSPLAAVATGGATGPAASTEASTEASTVAASRAPAPPPMSRKAVYATYHATDNLSKRYSPTAAPGASGGPRRGEALGVECQVEGEPAGPHGNRLYFWISYRAEHIYVPDAWTDSPHLASQPPIAGIPMCSGSGGGSTPSTTYINTTTPVRMCTNLGDASCHPVWNIAAGTTVTMRCWIDESSYAGTPRWFYVLGGGVAGFVSATHVSKQATVGSCNNDLQVKAIRWAGLRLDEGIYAGWCQDFVRDAYRSAGRDIGSGYGTAANYWRVNPKGYGRTSSTTPGPGALAYWAGTSGYPEGHVALSLGNGWTISTSERERSGGATTIHVMNIADRNRTKPYAGALNVT